MAARRELRCPACQGLLAQADLKTLPVACPYCNARIGVSFIALWLALPVGFVASILVVQLLDLKANAALLWFPILILCLIAALRVIPVLLPPRLKVVPDSAKGSDSVKKNLALFIGIWLFLILYLVAYGFVTGLLASIMQASDHDKMVVPTLFSVPLGLVNPAFLITPDKGLADVLGIMTANSYFYALVLTFILKTVHGFLSRSRTIQLGISDKAVNDDDVL
jgi:DNA-directed RNA polymerase subunit RPC12/RpoP